MKNWGPLVIAGALMIGIAIMASVIEAKGFHSQEAAAWAQAVGSVLAIGVTAWLAFIPIQAENRRRRQARVDFISMVTDAIDYATISMSDLVIAVADEKPDAMGTAARAWTDSGASHTLGELMEIPLSAWPTAMYFTRVHRLVGALNVFGRDIGKLAGGWNTSPTHARFGRARLATLRERDAEYRHSLVGLKLD